MFSRHPFIVGLITGAMSFSVLEFSVANYFEHNFVFAVVLALSSYALMFVSYTLTCGDN